MKKRRGTLSMLKLKEIIRLKDSSLSQQQIARSLNISVGGVHKYLKLAKGANVTWSLAAYCRINEQLWQKAVNTDCKRS